MTPSRPRPWLLGAALLCAAGVAHGQALEGTPLRAPEDVAASLEQLEQLTRLLKDGALPQDDWQRLRDAVLAGTASAAITGTLEDVPLPAALDALVRAAGKAGGRVSLVLTPADRDLLAGLRVSATLQRARDVDALRALLRLHETPRDGAAVFVEFSEEGTVFVVRAGRAEAPAPDLFVPDEPPAHEPLGPPGAPAPPRAWLGVAWLELNPLGPGAAGVRLTQVVPGSPAAAAGLQVGDLVVALDDEPVTSGEDVRARIAAHAPGDVVVLRVVRDGVTRPVSVALGAGPGQ